MSYSITRSAFSTTYLKTIENQLLESPYLGKSPLGKEFVDTRGFSIVFKRSHLETVIEKFPFLDEFLKKAIFTNSNAFYINPLILNSGSRVEEHVDCRLVSQEQARIIPNLVSVLYVKVDPDMEGGELCLKVGNDKKIDLKPSSNNLVHFLGTLIHSVNEVRCPCTRISLVCEQYNLSESLLAHFPDFLIIQDDDVAPRTQADVLAYAQS